MTKISIRFFQDREVRAVWDEEHSKWFFAAVDVVAALNEQDDATKANNYWRWLKRKLKLENPQLVSAAHGFKLRASNPVVDIAELKTKLDAQIAQLYGIAATGVKE